MFTFEDIGYALELGQFEIRSTRLVLASIEGLNDPRCNLREYKCQINGVVRLPWLPPVPKAYQASHFVVVNVHHSLFNPPKDVAVIHVKADILLGVQKHPAHFFGKCHIVARLGRHVATLGPQVLATVINPSFDTVVHQLVDTGRSVDGINESCLAIPYQIDANLNTSSLRTGSIRTSLLLLTHIQDMAVYTGIVVDGTVPWFILELVNAVVNGQLAGPDKRLQQRGLFSAHSALLMSQKDIFVITPVKHVEDFIGF